MCRGYKGKEAPSGPQNFHLKQEIHGSEPATTSFCGKWSKNMEWAGVFYESPHLTPGYMMREGNAVQGRLGKGQEYEAGSG